MSDPSLPSHHAAEYSVRFDELKPAGILRGSALLGYVQDIAWRHSEALGFPRSWYRERGIAWLVRAMEARILAPVHDGDRLTITTRLTGLRRAMARRDTDVVDETGQRCAVVLIDWAMTNGRTAVRIPAEFERVPIEGTGPFTPLRVALPPTPPSATLRQLIPRLRELDPMNHVNNSVYLDWLDESVAAASSEGRSAVGAWPRTYRMEYLRPAEPDAPLVAAVWLQDGGWAYRLTGPDGSETLRAWLRQGAGRSPGH